ncbi:cupin-like domain-containing protein [Cellvibrio japonicus]|uniref:N-acetyltransferase and Transcription factor-like protein n=1 Tax=Cellvibrio japonicus (strain Ueda107) TaxID=498211 RepID=B3PGK9_CELJU|nr:cupin-like domain-containing protein [Cellvibrio japonicus]ACE84032.1 N-acetyltransferase and Transcription factor-like protein [Cellvibrio japonicus Ueda107]QEI12358.1 cupin [Cellvibrio japonicus]QEI15931.1 cupin [Cellvibrio japonicus]QEI19510.1 cupin [Cellvibrio japonicus]
MELERIAEKIFARANEIPGMQGVLAFQFTSGDSLSITVSDSVKVGHCDAPSDVTIKMSTDDFVAVANKSRDLERLFTAGKILVEGDFGLATLLPQAIRASLSDRNTENKIDSNVEEQRFPAPERYSEFVTAAQPPLRTVERWDSDDLSPEVFYQQYVLPCKPVIITNALKEWPLYNMSQEESVLHFEGLQGMIRTGDYVSQTFSKNRKFKAESMADFIRSAKAYKTGDNKLPEYLGSNSLPESLETLIRWPVYFRHDQYIPPRIWIGPQGTVTPLHRDDSDNLFAQVWGEKAFILAAPHERTHLYAWATHKDGGLEGSEVNAEEPDYSRHPEAQEVNFLKVLVGSGDMLFIPDGWFHHVRSLSLSLSVNFWTTSVRRAGEM